jgi:copper(I)-binding protein
MPAHRRPTTRLAATLVAVALPLTACSQDNPVADEGAEVPGGAVGPDEMVTEDLSVLQVQFEYPLDGAYEEGDDARLFLGIANTGTEDDDLLDVTGPDFSDASLTVDGKPAAIRIPGDDNVYVGAEGAPSIVVEDLQTSLRSSQSIPVTIVFEDAGEVTLDVPVAAEGQNPTPPFDFPDPAEDPTS